MKKNQIVIAAAIFVGLLSVSSHAYVAPKVGTPLVKFEAPVPTRTVPVALPERNIGSTVTVAMTVDQNGRPHHVRVMSASDPADYQRLVAAVSQWQFAPARRNGVAVSSYVELPLEVVLARS